MGTPGSIRLCERSDISLVKTFLSRKPFFHRHLDWRDPLDWIDNRFFYLSFNNKNLLNGVFCCTPEIGHYYWVRIFACSEKEDLFRLWNPFVNLFSTTNELSSKDDHIYSLAYYPWMIQLLELEGWQLIDRIVQFEWRDENGYFPELINPCIKKMKRSHIEDAFQIDRASFQRPWQQSFDTFSLSFKQAGYATVFTNGGNILGFQISTIKNRHAHLARIAVHPQFRKRKIGEFLLKNFLDHCNRRKIKKITVNTQQSNQVSIALYKKWGFIEKGDKFPLFSLE